MNNGAKILVGLDVGSIAVKAAVITGDEIRRFACRRTQGRPYEAVRQVLNEIRKEYGEDSISGIVTTGSGGRAIRETSAHINEFQAISLASRFLHPETRTIFEIGGQTSKYILLDETGIVDYGINGDCAAGTGSFIDQQAGRLHYQIEDIGEIVSKAEKAARIAGRCSVFAKSDMIHAQQMGFEPPEVLRGLCLAVARNFKATIVKGRTIHLPALFIGGVALNDGVATCLKEIFNLSDKDLIRPKGPEFFGAIGSALSLSKGRALNRGTVEKVIPAKEGIQLITLDPRLRGDDKAKLALFRQSHRLSELDPRENGDDIRAITIFGQPAKGERDVKPSVINEPLSTEDVVFLRDRADPGRPLPSAGHPTPVYLGLDVGSVSTNLALIDEGGNPIYDIYTQTRARPIEVVDECLKEVFSKFADRIRVLGVGTTGSGRELIGELVGADIIRDEITAHKTGAVHISKTMTDRMVDTIFEIGGQDSKFIRIENGVVIDFTMNEACAAGTGSFLEEQAERLGISIKDEFAGLALSSKRPIRLGERCTVFMERDVNAYQLRGEKISDIVAGLSYSVVLNYLNRVVRGRNIGDVIFFQGGTAYNDAVAAAFSMVLEKKIIVPPHNGVIGAIGAALLAKDYICRGLGTPGAKHQTGFKGFDIDKIDYSIREFTCRACTNECDVQEFTVDGSKTYWGDKCSSRYRKRAKSGNKPILADLIEERKKLLTLRPFDSAQGRQAQGEWARIPTIGVPRAMYFYDRFPFWERYLSGIGFRVVVSDETNKKIVESGVGARVSEPCHPIGVAHGHILNLIEKGADYIWLPNILTAEPNGQEHVRPYLCPWGMTLPFMAGSSPQLERYKDRFITPTLHHMHGPKFLSNQLLQVAKRFGVKGSGHARAFENALAAQKKFRADVTTLGEMALHKLHEFGREAVVLVGRPYNIYDLHINLNIPAKIRSSYGVDVVPLDLLPIPETDIRDVADYMFWNYGKKILSAAKFIRERPNLHMIYVTNFKCGPDSFIKHFAKDACSKPFLTLQFDEHSNDAGIMTRIEAYLDSKGLLNERTAERQKAVYTGDGLRRCEDTCRLV